MIGKVLWWGVGMRLEGNFIILEGLENEKTALELGMSYNRVQ